MRVYLVYHNLDLPIPVPAVEAVFEDYVNALKFMHKSEDRWMEEMRTHD